MQVGTCQRSSSSSVEYNMVPNEESDGENLDPPAEGLLVQGYELYLVLSCLNQFVNYSLAISF